MHIEHSCLVTVEFVDDRELSVTETIDLIRKAVTTWIIETDAGKEMWEGTCEDFNIGDFFCHEVHEDLLPYLNSVGIKSIKGGEAIENIVAYDTILANSGRIEEARVDNLPS